VLTPCVVDADLDSRHPPVVGCSFTVAVYLPNLELTMRVVYLVCDMCLDSAFLSCVNPLIALPGAPQAPMGGRVGKPFAEAASAARQGVKEPGAAMARPPVPGEGRMPRPVPAECAWGS
jgi:hypothetical protein